MVTPVTNPAVDAALVQNPGSFQLLMQCAVKNVVNAFSTGGCMPGRDCPQVRGLQAIFNSGVSAGLFNPVKATWKPISGPMPYLKVDGLWGRNSAKVASNFVVSAAAFGGFYHDASRLTTQYITDRNANFSALCVTPQQPATSVQIAMAKNPIAQSPSDGTQSTATLIVRNTGQQVADEIIGSPTFRRTSFGPTLRSDARLRDFAPATDVAAGLAVPQAPALPGLYKRPGTVAAAALPAAGMTQTTMAVIGVLAVALGGWAFWAWKK